MFHIQRHLNSSAPQKLNTTIDAMSDQDQSPGISKPENPPESEHLNIKVTDNNNEVFFKIKRTTALKKLMDAFCDRQGKQPSSVRFLFDGARVNPTDSPDSVRHPFQRFLNLLRPSQRPYLFPLHISIRLHSMKLTLFSSSWRWPMGILWRFTKSRSEALKHNLKVTEDWTDMFAL